MAQDETSSGGAPVYQPGVAMAHQLGLTPQQSHDRSPENVHEIAPERERSPMLDLQQREVHELRPSIAELREKFSDEPGMNGKPDGKELPVQRVYDQNGRVLLEGHANSVQDLIQNSLKSCAESADPAKRELNLRGANLSSDQNGQPMNLQFSCFNFQNINLDGADLGGVGFDRCQFRNASMVGANIKDSSFMLCHFEGVDMAGCIGNSGTKLHNSSLYGVSMSGANLPGASLQNLRGQYVDWTGTNLTGASIGNVAIENLDARLANLSQATIGGLLVSGPHSTFDGARFVGASIGGSHFGTPAQRISMRGINASGSAWSQSSIAADLSYAMMNGASFAGLDIRSSVTPEGPISVEGCSLGGLARSAQIRLYPPPGAAAPQLRQTTGRF